MKKIRQILALKLIFLLVIIALSPVVFSLSVKTIEKNEKDLISEKAPTTLTVNVGDIYIKGTGDHETSFVMASAERDLRIKINLGGSDVMIEAKYCIQCPGLWDTGYAKLWVSRAEQREVETTDYAEGYLCTRAYDCEIGDTISWSVLAVYDDIFFPYPLTDYDAGGGIFTFSRSRSEPTPLFIQIFERLMNKCPLIKQLAYQLIDKIMVIKGKIICE